jgi:hypothetical protein
MTGSPSDINAICEEYDLEYEHINKKTTRVSSTFHCDSQIGFYPFIALIWKIEGKTDPRTGYDKVKVQSVFNGKKVGNRYVPADFPSDFNLKEIRKWLDSMCEEE